MNNQHLPMPNMLLGLVLFYSSMWSLSTMDASGKWLLGLGTPLITVAWMRYLAHFGILCVVVLPKHGIQILRTQAPLFQFLRAFSMLISTLTVFTALHYLPQAQTTAIAFLAPLIMLALAPWVLGEQQRLARWIAAVIGFAGVLIVIRPGAGLDPIGVIFALATAFFFAVQHLFNRRVAVDSAYTTLIWSGLSGAVVMTVALILTWKASVPVLWTLSPFQWLVLVSMGFTGALGHFLQIKAYQHAPASFLAPFMYLQITAASALGWWIWGDFPDLMTWIGIAVIISSGVGIAFYERWTFKNR